MITHMGRSMFPGVSHTLYFTGWDPGVPHIFGTPIPMAVLFDLEQPNLA